MHSHDRAAQLKVYETDLSERDRSGASFPLVAVICLAIFFSGGYYLKRLKLEAIRIDEARIEAVRARFEVLQPNVKPVPKPVITPPAIPTKPVDLTHGALLKQKENDITESAPQNGNQVARVYGLRRVYSVGLGAGTAAAGAVIGKLGNTISKDIDTVKPTDRELKGTVASVTTITSMPELLEFIKPVYTDDMRKNQVTGTVSVRILIDIDGSVKEMSVLNDLGYGTREAVLEACRKLRFKPAVQGKNPVAVWIIFKFKFVLQE